MEIQEERIAGIPRPKFDTRRVPPLALAVLSGLLLVLAYPSVDAGWLAWVALAPLLRGLRECSLRSAFALGWVTGLVWFGGILSWVRLFGEPPFNSVLWLLTVSIEAVGVGIFALLARWLAPGDDARLMTHDRRGASWPRVLLVPCLWTLTEWLRCTGPWGLPWGVLGETQARWTTLIQCADLGGVWLVSFLVAWGNAALAEGWPLRYRGWRPLAPVVTAVLLALLYGLLPRPTPRAAGPPLRIALVQADHDFWEYLALTRRQVAASRPDLVIWSETVVAGDAVADPAIQNTLGELAREARFALLAGTPHEDADGRLKNAAVLIGPNGKLAGAYEKVHLVPFGEYIPFRPFIPFLNRFPSVTDMSPGERYHAMGGARSGTPRVGVMICFESAFPEIGRALARDGAGLLAVLTSDAAFDRTSAPEHHARKAIFRAIETRRPVLQAAATGVTLAVDARGQSLGRLPMHRPGVLSVAVTPMRVVTLYTRLGDWVIAVCALVAVVAGRRAAGRATPRKRGA